MDELKKRIVEYVETKISWSRSVEGLIKDYNETDRI